MLATFPVVATFATKMKLLAQYGSLTLADLTPAILVDMAKVVGHDIEASPEMVSMLVDVLKQDDVDKISDLISNSGALNHVMVAVQDHIVKHEVTSFDLGLITSEDYV